MLELSNYICIGCFSSNCDLLQKVKANKDILLWLKKFAVCNQNVLTSNLKILAFVNFLIHCNYAYGCTTTFLKPSVN